jgi:glycosyltransferase involved in cell wall biosynthesis
VNSVDVIVPCYRYGHFLGECVESILLQSGPTVRVLIIDDASPDNTAEIAAELAQRDSRVAFVRHSSNRGHIATYNEGIEWASADYLLLLSADDYLLPGALSRAIHVFEAHPHVGLVIGKAIELCDGNEPRVITDSSYSDLPLSYQIMSGREFIEFSGCRNRVPTPTAVVRTSVQKQLGGYRPELPHTGDMEMWLRFAAHASIAILDDDQAVYRLHSSNMTISYCSQSRLPDLQQRKAALDFFICECPGFISEDGRLCTRLLRLLSLDAISAASVAFNEGKLIDSEGIEGFATDVFPRVKRSWPWFKLSCKRFIGFRVWSALRPFIGTADLST